MWSKATGGSRLRLHAVGPSGLNRNAPSERDPELRIVSIAFLPDEVERADALCAKVLEQATGNPTRLNPRADYDQMLDALTVAKAQAGVKNTATAFGLLLDLAEKHLEEVAKTKTGTP